jgi:hypothetical protein
MRHIRKGCASTLDTKVSALTQQREPIRAMEEEFQKLHAVAESQRTPKQHERPAELLADLILSHQWTGWGLTDSEMNAAVVHHVSQYK